MQPDLFNADFIRYIAPYDAVKAVEATKKAAIGFNGATVADLQITFNEKPTPIDDLSAEDIANMPNALHRVSVTTQTGSHSLDLPLTLLSVLKTNSEITPTQNAWECIFENFKSAQATDIEDAEKQAIRNVELAQSLSSMLEKDPLQDGVRDNLGHIDSIIDEKTEKAPSSIKDPRQDVLKELRYHTRLDVADGLRNLQDMNTVVNASVAKVRAVLSLGCVEMQKIATGKTIEQVQALEPIDKMMRAMMSDRKVISWPSLAAEKTFRKNMAMSIANLVNQNIAPAAMLEQAKAAMQEQINTLGASRKKTYHDMYIRFLSKFGVQSSRHQTIQDRIILSDLDFAKPESKVRLKANSYFSRVLPSALQATHSTSKTSAHIASEAPGPSILKKPSLDHGAAKNVQKKSVRFADDSKNSSPRMPGQ